MCVQILNSYIMLYLENRGVVRSDQFGSVGNEMTEEFGTLLLVPPDPAVLQLCQDLDENLPQGRHDEGGVETAQATNDTHGQLSDTKHLVRERERGGGSVDVCGQKNHRNY